MKVNSVGRVSINQSTPPSMNKKTTFTGYPKKNVDRFFKSTGNGEFLPALKGAVSKLHKDTVLNVYRHTNIYLPLSDCDTTYLLYATNKNIPNDKYVVAVIGGKDGIFGKKYSFIKDWIKEIMETIPHIDEIFVQHQKNLLSCGEQTTKKAAKMEKLKTFAKEANVNFNEEVDLNKYPMFSFHYM